MGRLISLRDLTGEGKHHRNRMLGRGNRVSKGRIHYNNAVFSGGRNIDIVNANPSATNHFQVFTGFNQRWRRFGRRTHGKTIILVNNLELFFWS